MSGSMRHAFDGGVDRAVLRLALERIDGAPAPELDDMQIAMGREAQVRAAHGVIREYLDEQALADTREWARRGAAPAPVH